jgi:RNA polymerase primary sigma factor/RNA polymerase sigma factor
MDSSGNWNCVQHKACFSRKSQQKRTHLCKRARQILELPLKYVPNQQFETWVRDKRAENEVLGPTPECSGPVDKAPTRCGLLPYVASLYEVPLLTREQEVHLFRKLNYLKYKSIALREKLNLLRPQAKLMARIEKLCQQIVATRNQIICANLRLVVSIAKRHLGSPQSFFELVSDGNVSLMRAVERFDYSLGNRFSTYATWAIVKNFARTIPEGMRYRSRFRSDDCDHFPEAPDIRSDQHELEAAQHGREIMLDGILRRLNDREREIIACRFGLHCGGEPQTLQQMGDVMGVSKERIRQIESRALSKLRQAAIKNLSENPGMTPDCDG